MSLADRAVTNLESAFTSIDLTNFDVPTMLESDVGRAAKATLGVAAGVVREATYVGVGLTVLGIQRTQARRRDLQRVVRR